MNDKQASDPKVAASSATRRTLHFDAGKAAPQANKAQQADLKELPIPALKAFRDDIV